MSINTFQKSRKKVVAAAMTGFLLTTSIATGAYAALSMTISTEEGSDKIFSTVLYNYSYTIESEPINANITPTTNPVAEDFVKGLENGSSVDTNFAVWVAGVDIDEVPTSLLDHTQVSLEAEWLDTEGDPFVAAASGLTLRQFLTGASVFNAALPANTDVVLTISVLAPNNSSPVDFSDAIGYEQTAFATNITFNQIVGSSSDLKNTALNHPDRAGISGLAGGITWFPLVDGSLSY